VQVLASAGDSHDQNETRMPIPFMQSPLVAEICASIKRLGYGVGESIHLYGEEFEVVSDPFPEDGEIAVYVKPKKGEGLRVVKLPATVIQSAMGRKRSA
jgi:hypothetical protein